MERDVRLNLLNTLLTTPHRDLAGIYPVHKNLIEQDPRFYVQMAAWYADFGDVRDHREMFVIALCLSKFEGHREVGLALLRRLPPYEVARVVDFIKGTKVKPKVKKAKAEKAAKAPARATHRVPVLAALNNGLAHLSGRARRKAERKIARQMREEAKAQKAPEVVQATTKTEFQSVGLGRNIPRSMRTEIERYLRERESDHRRLDSAILHARTPLKRLYGGLHIAPGERAQAILFDDNPPENSALYAVRQITKAQTPSEQARLIVQHRLPYRVAVSVVKKMSPTVLAALIDAMTPQEVINNMASLKTRGAFDNADIKQLIEAKIEAAKSDKRVSAYKAKVAVEAAGLSGEIADKLSDVTEAQVKAKGAIKRPTALLIDKSASMNVAIEVGRQLGAMISSICESDLYAYAFDNTPYPVEVQGSSLSDWEKALSGIKANGCTSCGVALEWMRVKKQRVEQIVMVTDEGENQAPYFRTAYEAYARDLNVRPDVIFVKVGGATDQLEKDCASIGVAPRAFDFKGDYYALTNLIPLLARPSMLELLMEILQYPLPRRLED
jgi:hypothetical protein